MIIDIVEVEEFNRQSLCGKWTSFADGEAWLQGDGKRNILDDRCDEHRVSILCCLPFPRFASSVRGLTVKTSVLRQQIAEEIERWFELDAHLEGIVASTEFVYVKLDERFVELMREFRMDSEALESKWKEKEELSKAFKTQEAWKQKEVPAFKGG